jgi:hypothetical protein
MSFFGLEMFCPALHKVDVLLDYILFILAYC